MADTVRSSIEGVISFSDVNGKLASFNLVIPDLNQTAFTKTVADNIANQILNSNTFVNKDGDVIGQVGSNGFQYDGSYTEEQTVRIFDIS